MSDFIQKILNSRLIKQIIVNFERKTHLEIREIMTLRLRIPHTSTLNYWCYTTYETMLLTSRQKKLFS